MADRIKNVYEKNMRKQMNEKPVIVVKEVMVNQTDWKTTRLRDRMTRGNTNFNAEKDE
jgi:hypothetical protein